MIRTSLSLPEKIDKVLTEKSIETGVSKPRIAILCLQRLKKNQKRIKLSQRATICYNNQSCPARIYPTLSENMHNYVQSIRFIEKTSVSFLFCLAIKKFISLIGQAKRRARHLKSSKITVHRKIRFQYRNSLKYSLVMINNRTG